MKKLFSIVMVVVFFAACSDSKPEKDLSIVPAKSTSTENTLINSNTTEQATTGQMPESINNGMPQTQAVIPQNVTAVTAAGMNPEHGQPGHRCEIQVGAPLSSAPARTATAPTPTTQPSIVQPAMNTPKTVTAKGMNPPHGEAGHRCDISVGAPLNSAPNTAKPAADAGSANITPMDAPTQNTSLIPAMQNSTITTPSKTSAAFSGKINPAHGQPGHDCKVAVGQPLP